MKGTVTVSKADVDYVVKLAVEAGHLAAQMREGVGIQEKAGPHDLVTEADFALSRLITERISARFPGQVIISEEDEDHQRDDLKSRVWLIDPIDGTDNYVKRDGQYCVMIGLLENLEPVYGWVYQPATSTVYYGGPGYGAFKQVAGGEEQKYGAMYELAPGGKARVAVGKRDSKENPWLAEVQNLEFAITGSIGLKVAKVLNDEADMYVHLCGRLKAWDTAGPVAIALGAGLEVGSLDFDGFRCPLPKVRHETSVIIGRPGSLAWSRANLRPRMSK